MVFIGLRAIKVGSTSSFKNAPIVHFNPHFIKMVNESTMILTIDDGTEYRIEEESLQIFLSVMYGEQNIKGDKLDEGTNF